LNYKILLFLATLSLSIHPCCNYINQQKNTVNDLTAAKLNNQYINLDQVDSCISQQLFDHLESIYIARKNATMAIINLKILSNEANLFSIDADKYLNKYYEKKLPNELANYYNNNKDQSIPIIKDHKLRYKPNLAPESQLKIIAYLKNKLKTQLLDSLRKKYNIEILLTPPLKKIKLDSSLQSYVFGNTNSNFEIIIFTDFDCSSCQKMYPFLKKLIIDNFSKIKFRIIYYSDDVYPPVLALNAANKQSKGFEMYQKLFEEKYYPFDFNFYQNLAFRLNLDTVMFDKDLRDTMFLKSQYSELQKINLAGISVTPTLIINHYLVSSYASETEIGNLIKTELEKYIIQN
jgi:predicted DsbA family dithiol-disulfide isomerase